MSETQLVLEHVDIVETMELEVAKIADAEDKIEAIKKHF